MAFDSLRVEHTPQTSSASRPSDNCQIYDARRAITFREFVEGVVRFARLVYMHTGSGVDGDNNAASSTSAVVAATGFPRNLTSAASHANTPRTPATTRMGAAPMEGGGSISPLGGRGRGASASSSSMKAPHDGGKVMAASIAVGDRSEACQRRVVQSVNADFKQFVGTHLSALLAKVSAQTASRGGGDRGGGRGGGANGSGRRGVGCGGGEVASRRGAETAGGSKRGAEDAGPAESACVKELSGAEEQVKETLGMSLFRTRNYV